MVLAAFTALVLNILGHVPRRWSDVTLHLLKLVMESTSQASACNAEGRSFTHSRVSSREFDASAYKGFPLSIQTVRKAFNLEARTVTYASCPACSFIYAPVRRGKVDIYPAVCSNFLLGETARCGAKLTRLRSCDGESIRSPLRPYIVQDFDDFLARFLSQEKIEDALNGGTRDALNEDIEEVSDVCRSSGFREFRGHDGSPFVYQDSGAQRLLWSFSVDWFNPFMNKAAGQSASVGCIAMVCLNLPPEFRLKPENMYLAAIIPGPKEPNADEINFFLEPIVDTLYRSYEAGTRLSRTHRRVAGVVTKSAILMAVMDLVAARKINACASHSAHIFCTLCDTRKHSINNIDSGTWVPRTRQEHFAAALAYKNASSKAERKRLFKKTGVRWSVLWKLPYWDTMKSVILDGMHALFVGLAFYHHQNVVGIYDAQPKLEDRARAALELAVSTTQERASQLKKARGLFRTGATVKKLKSIHHSVLLALCLERNVLSQLPAVPYHMMRKIDMVHALRAVGGNRILHFAL